jgi:hypothetical protein
VDIDPIASFRQWAIEVDLGGRVLRIPPTPAADWMPTLMTLDLWRVLDLAEDFDVDELLIDGSVTVAEVSEALLKVVEAASGRTTWAAMALIHAATANWKVVGAEMMRFAPRFDEMSLGSALDMIYATLSRCMDDKSLKKFDIVLANAPEELGGKPTRARASRRPVRQLPASAAPYVRERSKTRLRTPPVPPVAPPVSPTPPPGTPVGSGLLATIESPPAAAGNHPAESPEAGTPSPPPPTPH